MAGNEVIVRRGYTPPPKDEFVYKFCIATDFVVEGLKLIEKGFELLEEKKMIYIGVTSMIGDMSKFSNEFEYGGDVRQKNILTQISKLIDEIKLDVKKTKKKNKFI